MTIATAPKLESIHPPLARDSAGNFLPMPAGTGELRNADSVLVLRGDRSRVKSLFLCECVNGDHRELLVGHAAAA
jgi:hypothetical protein